MDDCRLYVGTEAGVHAYDLRDGEATRVGRGLREHAVRDVNVHPEDPDHALAACGLRGWGVHRTHSAGETWDSIGFDEEWAWSVTHDPSDPETVWVGTEPPMLYRSLDDGESFEDFPAIEELPTRDQWTFFYEPFEDGHLHGVAVDPEDPDRVYAPVEHGGFVFTQDGGATWDDSLASYDVHDAAVAPGTDRVFAAAGEGRLVSDDAGEEFEQVAAFEGDYVKQFLWHGDRLYVDATEASSSTDATIAYTEDDGDSWHRFEGVPGVSVTGCRLLAAEGDTLFHARDTDDGSEVVATDDDGDTWVPVGPEHRKVRAIEAAPLP